MSITGFPENPPTKSGQSISDYYAGMLCAFSIVSALHYRTPHRPRSAHRHGVARQPAWWRSTTSGERYTVGGEVLTRSGNIAVTGSSTGVYTTSDGHVAVSAGASDAVWRRFCQIIGREELTTDPASPRRPRVAIDATQIGAIIQAWTSKRPEGRGRPDPGHRGRAGGARQQHGRDGRRPSGAGARDVRRARSPDLWAAQADGHPAQDVPDAGSGPHAGADAGRAQRGHLRRAARPLARGPRALAAPTAWCDSENGLP